MKVALIADSNWLMHELTTFRRLAVGLVDEHVRVLRVVPQWALREEDQLGMAGEAMAYPVAAWQWLRDRRLKLFAERLREKDVDVLHVLDGSLQRVGIALGQMLNLPVVCNLWTREYTDQLTADNGGVPIAYAAATDGLVERARRRLAPASVVSKAPPGVFVSAIEGAKPPLADPARSLSVLVIGNGKPDVHFQALMEAIAAERERLGHALFFLYCGTSDQHALWRLAERFKLLNQVSLVPGEPNSRDLMVQADVVIQPQALGRARTLVLEAMAVARPIIAADDPMLDYLRHGETAILLPQVTPADWAAWLRQLVTEPQRFIDIGVSAQQYVQKNHSPSRFIQRMQELYHRMITPQTIPFQK